MNPLDKLVIDPFLLRRIAEIDEFKGRWPMLGNLQPERLSTLRRIATIASVGSSTRIEGSRLSDEEVEKLLARIGTHPARGRDEQEVAGYADLMDLVLESHADMPLTENHVRQLHGVMLARSGKDERHRGEYKKLPNGVEAFDGDGKSLGVIFETATPFDTPRLMRDLVGWARGALDIGTHHPILVIGVFVVRFLAIHPFQDGNGRLSRALTTLLLLRAGYAHVAYCSLERMIEENRAEYYKALRRAQATLDGDESGLGEWISFFVDCLARQKDALARKVDGEKKIAPVSPLSEGILAIVRDRGRVTVREASALTGASRNTIKDHLARLVKSGLLARQGRGRGTWYVKA